MERPLKKAPRPRLGCFLGPLRFPIGDDDDYCFLGNNNNNREAIPFFPPPPEIASSFILRSARPRFGVRCFLFSFLFFDVVKLDRRSVVVVHMCRVIIASGVGRGERAKRFFASGFETSRVRIRCVTKTGDR